MKDESFVNPTLTENAFSALPSIAINYKKYNQKFHHVKYYDRK